MTEHEFLGALEPWFAARSRPAWKPVTRPGDGAATVSKLGGLPALAPGEPWPTCPDCGRPMPLLLQLNLATLPEELGTPFGTGLLQLFACTSGEDANASANANANEEEGAAAVVATATLARLVADGPLAAPEAVPAEADDLTPRAIVLWQRFDDHPDFDDFDDLGLLTEYVKARPPKMRAKCPELGLAFEGKAAKLFESLDRCREGDKLGGWPDWPREKHWPACPDCGTRMQHVFQIETNDEIDELFGEPVRGHLMQCPTHQHVLHFAWDGG